MNLGPFTVTLSANTVLGNILPLVDCTTPDSDSPSTFSSSTSEPTEEEMELFHKAIKELDINKDLTPDQRS